MTKDHVKATIAGGAVLACLLAGVGGAYAASSSSGGTHGCSPTSLTKAVGPNGSSSADAKYSSAGGPQCAAPVGPVAPGSH